MDAWYAANAATVHKEASSETISTSASSLQTSEFYLVIEISTPTAVVLSDNEGETFAVVNNKLVAASGTAKASVTLTPKAYKTKTGDVYSDEATADELLALGGNSYTWTATATGRTRIADSEAHAFDVGYLATVTGTFDVSATGTLSLSKTILWYSVGGAATDGDAEVGDSATAEETASITGGFNIAFAA